MRAACSDASLLAHVMRVEKDFHVKAVGLSRTLEHPLPWVQPLLRAQEMLSHRWDQRRDYLSQSSSKSSSSRESSTKVVCTPLAEERRGGDRQVRTGTTWNSKTLCKHWNDSRVCARRCEHGKGHRCDLMLASGGICGSASHNRLEHTAQRHDHVAPEHGALSNPRTVSTTKSKGASAR